VRTTESPPLACAKLSTPEET